MDYTRTPIVLFLTLAAHAQRKVIDICRGVRQGSVLSPTLFLAVMDILLKRLRESGHGLHVRGTYMGGAIHADDLRTTAASSDSVTSQDKVIKSFTTESCLRLNTSKFEAVKISPHHHETAVIQIGDSSISTSDSAKCLGVWWNSCLSAQHSVSDNVNKARRAYFALGRLGAFQGYLNPLSSAASLKPALSRYYCMAVRPGCWTPPLSMH